MRSQASLTTTTLISSPLQRMKLVRAPEALRPLRPGHRPRTDPPHPHPVGPLGLGFQGRGLGPEIPFRLGSEWAVAWDLAGTSVPTSPSFFLPIRKTGTVSLTPLLPARPLLGCK